MACVLSAPRAGETGAAGRTGRRAASRIPRGARRHNDVVDPFAVLGVQPGASREELQAAYRRAAKRWHPDRAGSAESERRMAEVNAAWELLREGVVAPPAPAPVRRRRQAPGAWLRDSVRRSLATELLIALDDGEEVAFVARTATWASPQALLAVTDRRLLWLLDDAVSHRVRSLRFRDIAEVKHRPRRPLRRVSVLRVRTREGRRLAFSELRPATAAAIARHVVAGAAAR
jgi:DnaJ-like protein